jgi:hypothetical protein
MVLDTSGGRGVTPCRIGISYRQDRGAASRAHYAHVCVLRIARAHVKEQKRFNSHGRRAATPAAT